jgi:nucleoside-diphosphate-sugar epimerase
MSVKALVTGATGLLGRCVVGRLRAEGIAVRAFVRPGRAAGIVADEVSEGDLARPETLDAALANVDWVFHTGARVSTIGAWDEFEAVNVRGTNELMARSVAAGVKRIVHVSSLSVYDVVRDGAVVTEDGPFESAGGERGFYARSKLAADQTARAWISRGAPVVIARPGLLYGPGRRPPLARRVIALGPIRVILARRGYLLPLSYAENVADALLLAAQEEAARGRAYTVVDEHVRQSEYARLYREASGQRWVAIHAPVGLILMAASGIERIARVVGIHPPVTGHQVERTVRSATFSTERIVRELGWHPRVPLREALRRSFVPLDANSPAACVGTA